jgi:hypothetical protein
MKILQNAPYNFKTGVSVIGRSRVRNVIGWSVREREEGPGVMGVPGVV